MDKIKYFYLWNIANNKLFSKAIQISTCIKQNAFAKYLQGMFVCLNCMLAVEVALKLQL